jgi:hypothetical protein
MDIINAVSGAVVGAVVTLFISEIFKGLAERKRSITALLVELIHNLEACLGVLQNNAQLVSKWEKIKSTGEKMYDWWEILPLSESAWSVVVNTGLLARVRSEIIEPIARSYTLSRRADYMAKKIQFGRFDPEEAAQYTKRIYVAAEAIYATLENVRERKRYVKYILDETTNERASSVWNTNFQRWEKKIFKAERSAV